MIRKANGAFINFVSRESAEEAIKAVFNNLVIKGKILRCQWSKGKGKQGQKPVAAKSTEAVVVEVPKLSSLDQLLSMPIPPPPGSVASYYPSMDPLTSGSYYGGKDD